MWLEIQSTYGGLLSSYCGGLKLSAATIGPTGDLAGSKDILLQDYLHKRFVKVYESLDIVLESFASYNWDKYDNFWPNKLFRMVKMKTNC